MGAWLFRPARRESARARLFCFAHAGGGAATYRLWPASLPDSIDLVALQLPGRANRLRENPIERLDRLAEAIVSALEDELDLPFVFFGHSMGAMLAFEVVRGMRARGMPLPEHLIVSGRRAPGLPRTESDLHRLPDGEFVAEIGRRYGGIPQEILASPEMLELVLPALRADIAALETFEYVRQAPLQVPISAFGGIADQRATRAELDVWREETASAFRVRTFAGGHFYLDGMHAPLLTDIAAIMAPIVSGTGWRAAVRFG